MLFILNTLRNIHKAMSKLVGITDKADKVVTYVSKTTGVTVGSAGIAKGSINLAEAIVCQDNICGVISGIGVCADTLSIAISFIPGPNITSVVTILVSVGCKVFVWCCKRSRLPWGGC